MKKFENNYYIFWKNKKCFITLWKLKIKSMKVVYVLGINDGMLVFEKLVSLVEWFKERGVKELKFEDEEDMSIEDGIGFMLNMECSVMCKNEELFEMGDDYCELIVRDCELM